MPPRFAYWTILIDSKPTAFRARERAELLPTFAQLQRTNPDIQMKWFARGALWDSPAQAEWAARQKNPPLQKRGADWRPGGEHKDPRARRAPARRRKTLPDRSPTANAFGKRPGVSGSSRKGPRNSSRRPLNRGRRRD